MSCKRLFRAWRNGQGVDFLIRNYSNRNMMRLRDRDMLHDLFPSTSAQEVTDLCNGSQQCVYAGFDPTAKSLHVGNLLVLINLIHWQRSGHQVIALVGGATGRIGDPSGKSKEREEQTLETVETHVQCLAQNIRRIFDNHEKYFWKSSDPLPALKIEDNSTWYSEINAVDFICGIGRNFRLGSMLSRSSVESRLSSNVGMSFTEFSYQVFQAFDWLHLLKKHNCRFQIGGSDQMGNMMTGHELITRVTEKSVYGLTVPLIKSKSGDKFGKSAGNAVWLDPDMTSPFDLYQFFVRTPDDQVESLLKFFTFSSIGEVTDLMTKHKAIPDKWTAQIFLAESVTKLVHGEEGLESALRTSKVMYSKDLATISSMTLTEISNVFQGAPIAKILLQPDVTVGQLAMAAGCFVDYNDCLRIIKAGGFYINYKRSVNADENLVEGVHILPNKISLLRVGKRNYWIVKWNT